MNKNESVKGATLKKILQVVGDILLVMVIAIALFVLIISITAKKDSDGTATVFGYQLRFVQSDSMAKCEQTDVSAYEIKSIPVKSCVFIEVVPENEQEQAEWYKNLKVGDVLTFKYLYNKQETITHRIINITENKIGGYFIALEGDNKNSDSKLLTQIVNTSLTDSPNYVIGKVKGQSYLLGLIVYAFKSPVGIVCLIIIPCLIIIAFEVLRLVKVFSSGKKESLQIKQQEQADEIEQLKRQLALLQNKENAQSKEEPPTNENNGISLAENSTNAERNPE